MYPKEQKLKAVLLYIQYCCSAAATIKELGYPDRHLIRKWYLEYKEKGSFKERARPGFSTSKYSMAQMEAAVDFYVLHGRNLNRTIKALGYPSRPGTLSLWVTALAPGEKRVCRTGRAKIKYPPQVKEAAVIDFCTRTGPAEEVARLHGVDRCSLYFWKKQMPGKDYEVPDGRDMREDIDSLRREAEELRRKVRRLRLEKDVHEKAAEIVKKGKGIRPDTLTNREKAMVIDALRGRHPLKDLLAVMDMAKSSYCYQRLAARHDKYSEARQEIREIFRESRRSYGYRRIHPAFKNRGMTLSEKVIIRLAKELGLKVSMKPVREYNSYKREITPAAENLVGRNFHSRNPDELWLTDITEFHIPAGKVYLSPVIDCYDGMVVSWTIGTSHRRSWRLHAEGRDWHSVRGASRRPFRKGFHYRTGRWIGIMKESGLTRSKKKSAPRFSFEWPHALLNRIFRRFEPNWRKNLSCRERMSSCRNVSRQIS